MSNLIYQATVAANEAVSRFLNNQAPDLPPLAWTLRGRELSGLVDADKDGPEAAEVLSRWAGRFSLAAQENPMGGTAEYAGMIGDAQVLIWGVIDRAAWRDAPVSARPPLCPEGGNDAKPQPLSHWE